MPNDPGANAELSTSPSALVADRLGGCIARYASAAGVDTASTDIVECLLAATNGETLPEEVRCKLTPDNFYILLCASTDLDVYGSTEAAAAVSIFAKTAEIEFLEATTPEDDFTHTAERFEVAISTFIEENQPIRAIELMSEQDLSQVLEIYNTHNLLALAKQILKGQPRALSEPQLDMLHRYRVILQRLMVHNDQLQKLKYGGEPPIETKDGESTWASYIHPYGHRSEGVINSSEFEDFSEREDLGVVSVIVDGVVVKLANLKSLS